MSQSPWNLPILPKNRPKKLPKSRKARTQTPLPRLAISLQFLPSILNPIFGIRGVQKALTLSQCSDPTSGPLLFAKSIFLLFPVSPPFLILASLTAPILAPNPGKFPGSGQSHPCPKPREIPRIRAPNPGKFLSSREIPRIRGFPPPEVSAELAPNPGSAPDPGNRTNPCPEPRETPRIRPGSGAFPPRKCRRNLPQTPDPPRIRGIAPILAPNPGKLP
jgi:hypothetical protein